MVVSGSVVEKYKLQMHIVFKFYICMEMSQMTHQLFLSSGSFSFADQQPCEFSPRERSCGERGRGRSRP